MGFDLSTYATVEERLALFWAAHPDGRIHTEIVRMDDHAILFHASVYRNAGDTVPAAVGHAYEERSERGVNATSHVENAETSAIGRALANWIYAAGKRPSREEMQKVERLNMERLNSQDYPPGSPPYPTVGEQIVTPAQIKMLRALRYPGDPTRLTKRQASVEIDRLKAGASGDQEDPF